jgi:hypothetical protein
MGHVERIGQVDHAEALRHMQRARVLLLPVNDTPNVMGFLPAKVFEYLSVQRPILCIAPAEADIRRVLGQDHCVLQRQDPAAFSSAVRKLFGAELPPLAHFPLFQRSALTNDLAVVLDRLSMKA